jgi:hypothetical protein
MIKKSKQHLEASQVGYFEHLTWAVGAGFKLIWAGIASLIHSIVPALFPGTAAYTVIDLYHKRLENHPNKDYKDYIDSKK